VKRILRRNRKAGNRVGFSIFFIVMKKKVLFIVVFALAILAVSVLELNACRCRVVANDKGLYSNSEGTIFCCKALTSYECSAADCS